MAIMQPISKTFEAWPLSVSEVFQYGMGATSFRIPIYQRNYRWPTSHIQRLVEDVSEGLKTLGQSGSAPTLTFLGTLILVDDTDDREPEFPGSSLAVVDGQQRLTSLALILVEIHRALWDLAQRLSPDDPIDQWLRTECECLRKELLLCCVAANPNKAVTDAYQFVPVIVRKDKDYRATNKDKAGYESPIGKYLFDFSRYYLDIERGSVTGLFEYHPVEKTERQKVFDRRVEFIRDQIQSLVCTNGHSESESEVALPDAAALVYDDKYRRLFSSITTEHSDVIRKFKHLSDAALPDIQTALIKLLAFGSYMLNRVAMTFVKVRDERYAFDIFEALNTTGESLTAIETFKPIVIHYEDQKRDTPTGYQGSNTERLFEDIEQHIYRNRDARGQQKESQELVIQLALYASGVKQSRHLSSQRTFLRGTYEKQSSPVARQRFVKMLHDLVEYRRRFWDKNAFREIRDFGSETQLTYCCLALIADMNTSLTCPILTRYWTRAWEENEFSEFVEAVKAITAFLILRRAATGGTANIDGDFRALMQRGHRRRDVESKPLMAGLGEDSNTLPRVEELRPYLRSYLEGRPVRIVDKESWVGRLVKQPLKERSAPLCRVLLLAAATNARPQDDRPYLLKKVKPQAGSNYLAWDVWRNEDFQSVEHIAPESGGGGVWPAEIYSDPDLRHTIGNLALLPAGANSAVGDASPEKKWLMYQALSAPTPEDAEHYIDQADKQGLRFTDNLKQTIRKSRRLPGVAGIGNVSHWTPEVIEVRSRNIGELAWSEIAPWLGFKK